MKKSKNEKSKFSVKFVERKKKKKFKEFFS